MALWHFPMTGTYQIIFPEICKMLEVLLGEKYIYNIAIYRLVIDCSSGPIPIYEIKIDIWFIYLPANTHFYYMALYSRFS